MAKQEAVMQEGLEEMIFPLHGVSLIKAFEGQPQGTTPIGQNVRTYEALTQRGRGGARPGLVRYINSPVDLIGGNKIQHLNIIVDPTTEALIADDPTDPFDPTFITDPSTNNLSQRNFGRRVRRGGSGRQPNRNRKNPARLRLPGPDIYPIPLPTTYGAGNTPVPPGWNYRITYTGIAQQNSNVIGARVLISVTRAYSLPDGGHTDTATMNLVLLSNSSGGAMIGVPLLVHLADDEHNFSPPFGCFG